MKGERYTRNLSSDLSRLVDMDIPGSVFAEVQSILSVMYPGIGFQRLGRVFKDTVKLFEGKYLGYRKCNTGYHDLKHTTDVLLCASRLLHGFHMEGLPLDERLTELCLTTALLHDSGYIQSYSDHTGTGAKYTMVHVERSIVFIDNYFEDHGYPREDFDACKRIVLASDPDTDFKDIPFSSEAEKTAGKALFAGEILGQMADRLYLEKLLLLYRELREARAMELHTEDDLLEKTVGIYELMKKRLKDNIDYSEKFMRNHFSSRWNIDFDMYMDAVKKNMDYLRYILEDRSRSPLEKLNRAGIAREVRKKEGKGEQQN